MTTAEREKWLRDRQSGIGASDAASIAGCGFRTAADVYREKTEPVNATVPESGYLRRGLELEPVVARMYEEKMGVLIVEGSPGSIVRHPDRPWQFCSLDRRRSDDGRAVELKTTAGFNSEWGDEGTDEVPEGYKCQAAHQMTVTGTTMLDLVALDVIAWNVRVYRIDLDPAFAEWLTGVESRFWHSHVLPRVSPPSDWTATVNPQPVRTLRPGTIDLGDDAAAVLDQRRRIARIRDEADSEYRRLTEQIDGMMGDSERAVAGSWKLRRSFVKGDRVTYDRRDYFKLTVSGGKD